MAIDMFGLGKRINELRNAFKLNITELAQKAKISASTVSRIEAGINKDISLDSIDAIARALNRTTDYLAYGEPVDVPLINFVDRLPPEEAEYIRQHKDESWITLVREMQAEELTPGDVADIIAAIRSIKGQK